MALVTGESFVNGNDNVPGAAQNYQSFLYRNTTIADPWIKQIGPFAFDYKGDDCIEAGNEITDHWLEDNTAVQDHIGVRPTHVLLRGQVSELTLSPETQGFVSTALAAVENALSQVPAYLGRYATGTTQTLLATITQAQNVAVQIEQAAARLAQISSFFLSGSQLNKQQIAFATLYALRNARTVFTVYTPFQVFYNMVIEDLAVTQPARTRTISDFTVKMKQLQFTDAISQSSFQTRFGGRAVSMFQPRVSNGATTGIPSLLSKIQRAF